MSESQEQLVHSGMQGTSGWSSKWTSEFGRNVILFSQSIVSFTRFKSNRAPSGHNSALSSSHVRFSVLLTLQNTTTRKPHHSFLRPFKRRVKYRKHWVGFQLRRVLLRSHNVSYVVALSYLETGQIDCWGFWASGLAFQMKDDREILAKEAPLPPTKAVQRPKTTTSMHLGL